ncbi:hypothetical protein ACI2IP_07480 [Microbacterium sp. NPDC090218]
MDVVVEAAGVTSALVISSALVRPYGTVCIMGYHHTGDAPMDMELWHKDLADIDYAYEPMEAQPADFVKGAVLLPDHG